jgi:hypothetical protein
VSLLKNITDKETLCSASTLIISTLLITEEGQLEDMSLVVEGDLGSGLRGGFSF